MTRDQEIYLEIVKLICSMEVNIENPRKFMMKSELNEENDVGTFEFYYCDNNKYISSPGVSGIYLRNIRILLVELREFFLKNNQPYWKGCNFEVNLETGSYEVNFVYE